MTQQLPYIQIWEELWAVGHVEFSLVEHVLRRMMSDIYLFILSFYVLCVVCLFYTISIFVLVCFVLNL